jgi:TrpR-related protein YerC/YecD
MFSLFSAFKSLQSEEEFELFLKDLCTPNEIKDLKERFLVAQELYNGGKSYRKIHQECSASLVTITRVARFLNQESYQGYRTVLNRLYNKG